MTDSVKNIFEIIGVSPDEKFKIKGLKGIYFIDAELCLRNEEKGFFPNIFLEILRDPFMIIKLPKEPKKKKLKDLTPWIFDKWRDENCNPINCDSCVFRNVNCYRSFEKNSWIHHKELYSDVFLDQEVEVKE